MNSGQRPASALRVYNPTAKLASSETKRRSYMKLLGLGRLAVAVSFLVLGAYALASPPTGGYHLLKKIPFGAAEGGGEYYDYITIDAAARRVYLSHGTEIIVVDADSGAMVGT